MKVRIKRLPKAESGIQTSDFGKAAFGFYNGVDNYKLPDVETRDTLSPVDREDANLEAERGEVVVTDLNKDGMPELFKIAGKPHSKGGTPLNLPDNSFIFSKTKDLLIKDPDILKMFGASKPTLPADLAKKYAINDYHTLMHDPTSDKKSIATAEKMVKNHMQKLGKLALVQESMKGFPQGIPKIALAYMKENNIDPNMLQGNQEQQEPQMRYGGSFIPMASQGLEVSPTRRVRVRNFGNYSNSQYPYQYNTGLMPFAYGGEPEEDPPVGTQGTTATTTKPSTTKTVSRTKAYDESDLPKTAIKYDNPSDPNIGIGDYIKGSDGKYRKVVSLKETGQMASVSGEKAFNTFYPGTSIDAAIDKANSIMNGLSVKGYAHKGADGYWTVEPAAAKELSLDDRAFLTRVSSIGTGIKKGDKELLGAVTPNKSFVIAMQKRNLYANHGAKGPWDESFGWAGPDLQEYLYWKSMNPGKSNTQEAFNSMPEDQKTANRKSMLNKIGFTDEELKDKPLNDPKALYTGDFIGNSDNGLVKRLQEHFGQGSYRPDLGNDYKLGLEHMDFNYPLFNKDYESEQTTETIPGEEDKTTAKAKKETNAPFVPRPEVPYPFFIQDKMRAGNALYNLASLKRYPPVMSTYGLNPYLPEPYITSPERELAANEEMGNAAMQSASNFGDAQQLNARMSAINGQGAGNAANIMSRYANQNAGILNQFSSKRAGIMNQYGQEAARRMDDYYKGLAIMNQQYDNSKRQGIAALTEAGIQGITNRANAYDVSQMSDQYGVDPNTGGTIYFKRDKNMVPKESNKYSLAEDMNYILHTYPYLRNQPEIAYKVAMQQRYPKYQADQDFNYQGYPGANYMDMMQYTNPTGTEQ